MPSSSSLGLADLALTWSNDSNRGNADLTFIDGDLAVDRGLVTAVLLSLFTDRRAEDDDVPPSGDPTDRRGWWADEFAAVEGDKFGSRLWLLDRSTLTNETTLRAKEYIREALAWMVEDKVVDSIDAIAERLTDALVSQIGLQNPGKDPTAFRFAPKWDHMLEDA